MTVREHFAQLEGLKMGFVGDGFNMCNSLIVGCLKVGMKVSVATPEGYEPDAKVLAFAEEMKKQGASFELSHDIHQAADNADVLFTDACRRDFRRIREQTARTEGCYGHADERKIGFSHLIADEYKKRALVRSLFCVLIFCERMCK